MAVQNEVNANMKLALEEIQAVLTKYQCILRVETLEGSVQLADGALVVGTIYKVSVDTKPPDS